MKYNTTAATVLASTVAMLSAAAHAQDASATGSPLRNGSYIAPVLHFVNTDDQALDDGWNVDVNLGIRKDYYAMEIGGVYADLSGATQRGVLVKGLLFPFRNALPGLFLSAGVGALETDKHPSTESTFHTITTGTGAGYILPVQIAGYEFGIRVEATYRYGQREKDINDRDIDLPVARHFGDTLLGIGLQLPLGKPVPPPAPPPAAAMVPVVAICADGQDNDGDGQADFPADKGCSAADDVDESDPPACGDGQDNDGDGLVDHPEDKGCTAADDTDEADPCKTPAVGERVSLRGCGTGDVIVLRGVNFEFDQARLTTNARTILDGVAAELVAYPDIHVQIAGHTDAKGSDAYNERLSAQRAAAVVDYLASKGVKAARMTSVGLGESQPVADNETEEGRELNRRVELKIVRGNGSDSPATGAVQDAAPALEAEPTPELATAPADGAAEEPATAPTDIAMEVAPESADEEPAMPAAEADDTKGLFEEGIQ
jgi:outer membrane protein OmpA-like peptidoglycan-associated protein